MYCPFCYRHKNNYRYPSGTPAKPPHSYSIHPEINFSCFSIVPALFFLAPTGIESVLVVSSATYITYAILRWTHAISVVLRWMNQCHLLPARLFV